MGQLFWYLVVKIGVKTQNLGNKSSGSNFKEVNKKHILVKIIR